MVNKRVSFSNCSSVFSRSSLQILSATSRFFMYIIGSSRVKMIKHMEVLHVKDVAFEDLYDLIGYIYNDWQFDCELKILIKSYPGLCF